MVWLTAAAFKPALEPLKPDAKLPFIPFINGQGGFNVPRDVHTWPFSGKIDHAGPGARVNKTLLLVAGIILIPLFAFLLVDFVSDIGRVILVSDKFHGKSKNFSAGLLVYPVIDLRSGECDGQAL